jgi:hypothetical protein
MPASQAKRVAQLFTHSVPWVEFGLFVQSQGARSVVQFEPYLPNKLLVLFGPAHGFWSGHVAHNCHRLET